MKRIGIVSIVFIISLILSGCFLKNEPANLEETTISGNGEIEITDDNQTNETKGDQLKIEDIKIGDGTEAKVGDIISVNYTGTLTDGTKFDSSYDRNQPFEFNLGTNQVIKGWDIGVIGMKVGGKRKLTIPPDLAYGSRAVDSIPANSTLIFEIELLEIK